MKVAANVLEHAGGRTQSPFWEMTMLDFNDSEQFRELKDFPGYGVGVDGTVWSRRTSGQAHIVAKQWKQLKPVIGKNGYYHVRPCVNKRNVTANIHILVLTAFVGPPPFERAHGRHLDSNKINNHLSNLRWGTASENKMDSFRIGVVASAKLNEEMVRKIRELYATGDYFQRELAVQFGVTRKVIEKVVNRVSWTHVS